MDDGRDMHEAKPSVAEVGRAESYYSRGIASTTLPLQMSSYGRSCEHLPQVQWPRVESEGVDWELVGT